MMKNITIALLAGLALSSCQGAYETLSTPFKHVGKGLGYIGSTVVGSTSGERDTGIGATSKPSAVGAFEIAVKAPSGSVVNTAVDLFHKEARKICGGAKYKHKITHKGTTSHVEYARTSAISQEVPTVKGVVICNEELKSNSAI